MINKLEKLNKTLQDYCVENDFKLNPDEKYTKSILTGLLKKHEKFGDLYCPCRLMYIPENFCPCEFHKEEIANDGKCTCNLIVRG
jgi:ferredoxin-thioredoxin reductase catalytic subunit